MRAKPKRRVHYYATGGRSVSINRGDRRREHTLTVLTAIKLADVINKMAAAGQVEISVGIHGWMAVER